MIKVALINCFLSKEEKGKPINEIKDIEIVRKGLIARSYDSTRLYIRIIFKDDSTLEFGETLSFLKIEMKYRQCVAILKGLIMPEVITDSFITDEVVDETKNE